MKETGAIVVMSDLQAGGSTAVMPPTFTNEDGQKIKATRWQGWLWECWNDVCYQVKDISRKEPVFVLVNGDATEGDHHQTLQLVTHDETAHSDLAIEILDPLMQHASACAFVRGTKAHVGSMARLERLVAKAFVNRGLIKTETGGLVHPVFKRTIFGKRINAAHHTMSGRTKELRIAALCRVIIRHTMNSLRDGVPCADYIVRSHVHYFTDTEDIYKARAFTTPSWQCETEFVNRIAPDEMSDIGAVIIRNGEVKPILYKILKEDRKYPVLKIDYAKKTKATT